MSEWIRRSVDCFNIIIMIIMIIDDYFYYYLQVYFQSKDTTS